uniref:Uncharacterized protein n=1 Tax=viral metagenome TaxID=1070528 RepID=A0A6C0IW93_9ZZZZ
MNTSHYSANLLKYMNTSESYNMNVSIHLTNILTHEHLYIEEPKDVNIKDELCNFISLSPNEITWENLEKLKEYIILYQYPDTSAWSKSYHMSFMHIENIDKENDHLILTKYKKDTFIDSSGEEIIMVDRYAEKLYILRNQSSAYRIWLPFKVYLDTIADK